VEVAVAVVVEEGAEQAPMPSVGPTLLRTQRQPRRSPCLLPEEMEDLEGEVVHHPVERVETVEAVEGVGREEHPSPIMERMHGPRHSRGTAETEEPAATTAPVEEGMEASALVAPLVLEGPVEGMELIIPETLGLAGLPAARQEEDFRTGEWSWRFRNTAIQHSGGLSSPRLLS